MTGPFILRRLKKDVLNDLPEKLEEVRYAKAGKTQQELYDSQLSHMKEILSRQDNDDLIKTSCRSWLRSQAPPNLLRSHPML